MTHEKCREEYCSCVKARQKVDYISLINVHQDKILQSLGQNCDIQVTNDGATILKSINIDNPAAKILVGKVKPTNYKLSII